MVSSIFNWDNPFWKYLGRIADALLLTILWAVSSIPLVTIGASTTALFYCAMKIVKDEEGGTIRQFFKSFRQNLLQSTVIWLVCVFVGGLLGWNLFLFYGSDAPLAKVAFTMLAIFFYLYLMILHYIFAVLARFDDTTVRLFEIAFYLSVKNFGWTMLMITISLCIAVISIFIFWGLLAIGVGLAALLDGWMLGFIFDKYIKDAHIGEE